MNYSICTFGDDTSFTPDCSRLILSSPKIESGKVPEAVFSWLAWLGAFHHKSSKTDPTIDWHTSRDKTIWNSRWPFLFPRWCSQTIGTTCNLAIRLRMNLSQISLFWYVIGKAYMWSGHYRGRDLASDPSASLFGQAIVIWDGQKNAQFGPFYPISGHFDVLDNFGRVLLFKITGNFEILAKSLYRGTKIQTKAMY